MACEPSPPAIASPSAPPATASRTSPSRSHGGPSSIGSIPRARASAASENRSALPPPDFGLKNSTGRCGAAACGRWARTPNAARAQAQLSTSAATTSTSSSRRSLDQQDDRRAEAERADRQAGDARRAASQDAVPGRRGGDGDAGERDQAARELLHRDDDRER